MKRSRRQDRTPKAPERDRPAAVREAPKAELPNREETLDRRDRAAVCLYSVLLFAAMTIQTGWASIVLAILALALSVGKGPVGRIRERLCLPVAGLLAYAVMNALAAIYSHFGDYAVGEFFKIMASFSVAVILLARFEKKHVRALLWGICAVCAAVALLCVDLSSWGGLFSVFQTVSDALGSRYASLLERAGGARINGIYNDGNLTGAILGMAMFAALYLVHTEETLRKRAAACLLLGISGVGFLTAMSRGAILSFALSALVYLAAERKDRTGLFFLMVSAAVSILAAGGLAMTEMELGSLLPDLLCFACGALIFALNEAAGRRLATRTRGHGAAVLGACLALALLAGGAAFIAVRTTQPFVFTEGSSLVRGASLRPGEHTLSGDWEGTGLGLTVYSQTRDESLLNKRTYLYSGALDGAAFTVPEDAVSVFFQFGGAQGDTLRSVEISDGTSIPMAYKWLPEGIVGRLQQNLFVDNSFLLRVQFMKDAWTLFTQSPLIGHGLGSTEGLYTSVQPFFYESLYVHDHILQVMDDMGLLGLLSFLTLLLGSAWLLLRRVLRERNPLAAALLGCWVMMNVHSLMEINFSIRAFQCVAFLFLLLPVLLYAEPLPIPQKTVKLAGRAAAAFIWAYLLIFGGLLTSHLVVVREAVQFATSDVDEFMEALRSYVRRDVFDHESYQLDFVGNAVLLGPSRYKKDMVRYAGELRASGTYYACSGLARYYYLPREEFEELFACSREGIAQEASTKEAWNLQIQFYRSEVLPAAGAEHIDVFVQGVLDLRDYLDEWSEGRLEEIELTEENRAFLDAVSSAVGSGMEGDALYAFLTAVSG